MTSIKQKLRETLHFRKKQCIIDINRAPSAVLLPLCFKQGQYYILFTKRTQKVKYHKGEISFPGGACEAIDNEPVDTAIRETTEEIGLMPDDVEILGELDDTSTISSNYIISPFVAFIPYPYQFRLNRDEAEEIIEIPVAALLEKDCLKQETEDTGNEEVILYSYYYQDLIIHGATAKILNQFLDIFVSISCDNSG